MAITNSATLTSEVAAAIAGAVPGTAVTVTVTGTFATPGTLTFATSSLGVITSGGGSMGQPGVSLPGVTLA